MHKYTYIYIIANSGHTPHTAPVPPSPTPDMQLLAGYLELKLILKCHQNALSNSNVQINDIMKKSFTHCTIDVMSLVILILKLLKLYGPFLWMGFNCLKAIATSRRQFTFYH